MSTATATPNRTLTATISPDAMGAVLQIPAGLGAGELTLAACSQPLASVGVVVNDEHGERLTEQISAYLLSPVASKFELRGKPAVHGKNGYIAWEADCNPDRLAGGGEQAHRVDHYNRKSYIAVSEKQKIGRIIAPTAGQDGLDLRGHVVASKAGEPTPMKVDDTILVDSDGVMTASRPGQLKVVGNAISIMQQLQIAEYVDFHTGNVCFDGEVEIKGGIRDKFSVEATGNVTVLGLIEAATLKIGGDLNAPGGIAAKGKSSANIEGNLNARYLNGFCGRVKRNAVIDREIIDCELSVEGDLIAPGGELMGGKTHVGGAVNLKSLGAASGDRTVLALASIRSVEIMIARMDEVREKAMTQLKATESELEQMKSFANPPASVREKLTELMFEQSNHQETIKSMTTKTAGLQKYTEKMCKVELTIQQVVQPGTVILCRGISATFDERVSGPLSIGWDGEMGQLVYKQGANGQFQPLAAIARVQHVMK